MLPLPENERRSLDQGRFRFPFVTIGLIAICVWVFIAIQPISQVTAFNSDRQAEVEEIEFLLENAAIPCEVVRGAPLTEQEVVATFGLGLTSSCSPNPRGSTVVEDKSVFGAVLYSMFFHGGWIHLVGNLLFLWVFGQNLESRLGHLRYLAFYIAAGLVATIGYVITQYDSSIPIVGASGAIAGVMGAFLVMFPTARIRIWLVVVAPPIPASLFLIFWFLSQFQIAPDSQIAWVSHVVGFVFGIVAALWFKSRRPPAGDDPMFMRHGPRPLDPYGYPRS